VDIRDGHGFSARARLVRVRGGVRRSAVVVGRQAERSQLRDRIRATRGGATGCVFLTGEGGIGKSRLLAEAVAEARRRGLAVLVGRGSLGAPASFGVIAEALRSWLRALPPADRAPTVYDPGLRLILPEWPTGSTGGLSESQLRLLALEGLVHVVREIASGDGLVLVVDDAHEADAESLESLRYLVGAELPSMLVLAAMRPSEAPLADHLVETLAATGLADVWTIEPMSRTDVDDLVVALVDVRLPAEFVDDVVARTDGVPLLVEEVVDAHLRAGSLALDAGAVRWRGGANIVPRGVAALVASRLERLSDAERDVLVAGSLVGLSDADLLATVAAQPASTVRAALAAAVDSGLVEAVGGQIQFRHAVTSDAVQESALPSAVRVMHARAAAALVAAPDDDVRHERRARHLAAIGEDDAAAEALIEAATANLGSHALLRAAALAARASELAISPATRDRADDARAATLAAQGRWSDALALDRATVARSGQSSERWMRMARCALDGRLLALVRDLAADASEIGADSPYVDIIRGRLALAEGEADTALACAQRALDGAVDDARHACDALDLQARALDYAGQRDAAADAWARQADVAARAGLTAERLRAIVSLAELELLRGQPLVRMREAVELAAASGALVEQAWAELNLTIALTVQGDPVAGAECAAACVQRCRDLRLDLLPFALAAQAGAAAYLGDPTFEAQLAAARQAGGDAADLVVHTSGIAGEIYMQTGRLSDALVQLDVGTEAVLANPGGIPSDAPYWRPIVLCVLGRAREASDALALARSLPDPARWHSRPMLLALADALLARDESAFDAALASVTGRMPYELALLRVFAAEAIGGPSRTRWLREALDIYDAHSPHVAVDRVRGLLRDAGGAVPRRRRTGLVPPGLISYGVTAREAEVLGLVVDGLPNSAIAERLFVSVRTVESHVSSLLAKLGASSRADLAIIGSTSPPNSRQ
jgi:DNA-binding CsgD family transcriptional regulator